MLHIIVSPTRSGSTALMRCFENNPAIDHVYHQPVKSGFREGKPFDYGIYDLEGPSRERKIVAKETIGGFLRAPNKKRFWDAVVVDGVHGETFGQ